MSKGLDSLYKITKDLERCYNEFGYPYIPKEMNEHYNRVKQDLERLEKLEKVVEILKGKSIIVVDKNFMTINTNGIWRNDNSGGYDVLKEVFGNENS